ncbi:hypothetical protein CEXT_312351 [Caerostris extrusa]|uniref:Uncharacterized protein n=1 Tax=Caerostris extrusa TaxID=172846 RepID=A0AAV4Y7Q9_CAEEX|nr:hypothetical protein CEXT_312351 [Caerostris extrusa]
MWKETAICTKKNIDNNEDLVPVEPPVAIKVEPVEFVPEPSTSAEIVIQNVQKGQRRCSPIATCRLHQGRTQGIRSRTICICRYGLQG